MGPKIHQQRRGRGETIRRSASAKPEISFARFNVAVTRAKALLIVVGNPNILANDPKWKVLIDYIYEEGEEVKKR